MKHKYSKALAPLLALTLVGAACGSDDDTSSSSEAPASTTAATTPAATDAPATDAPATDAPATDAPTTEATTEESTHDSMDTNPTDTSMSNGESAGVETGAATLRAGLTSLLQEHVYLAGIAIGQAVQAGGDMEAPAVASAVSTLDDNSVALSEAVASVYGEEAGAQFLELWRNHIGFFVEYTLGGATGDTEMQAAAKEKLDNYRADFGAFIDSATGGNLDAQTVADNLQVHVDTLMEAIDAVLAGDDDVYTKLQMAAMHMPSTAGALSGAIVTQNAADFAGDPASPASELRSGLTYLLQEHVYLAGIAINQAVADGGDLEAPLTANAVATLDANSVALSDAVASVYGEAGGAQFLELWRNHIGFFVEYTLGGATGDAAMQDEAKAKLDNYREDFGAFIESATEGNLGAQTVADNLQVHVDTLLVAVDSVLAASPDVFPQLREAAQHMPGTALALSGAIVAQYPDDFAG